MAPPMGLEGLRAREEGVSLNLRPSIAGTWYPSDPDTLQGLLRDLLESASGASDSTPLSVRGLLVPHAGYAYSGGVAARAYGELEGSSRELVVILGPFHAYHEAPLLVCQYDAYQTPLGQVPIERGQLDRIHRALADATGMGLTPIMDTVEHSIEIQLPFLQTVLGPFDLVPIMLAHQTPSVVDALANALFEVLQGLDVLLIASSDLSHFNPQHLAVLLDKEMLRRIKEYQVDAVLNAEAEGAGSACGAGAVATMLRAARDFGAQHSTVLMYRTSGDITGDYNSVVGYAAARFW